MPRAPGRWSTLLIAALGCWACSSTTEPSNGDPPGNTGPASVLVVTHTEGFRHSSIAIAETTIAAIGTQSGLFTTTFCRTADDVTRMLTPGALSGVDAIVFANTTGTLPIPDLAGVLNWIAQGRGFAGMHSASDTFHGSSAYLDMLGNEFQTHGLQTSIDAIVENRTHPASSPLGDRYRVFDEIYKFTRANRSSVTMLLSLDRHPDDGLPEAGQPGDLPLAWAKGHGQGRVFYTALGHREEVWQDPLYQQHILGGIRWILRR